jgi:hypothetical protein
MDDSDSGLCAIAKGLAAEMSLLRDGQALFLLSYIFNSDHPLTLRDLYHELGWRYSDLVLKCLWLTELGFLCRKYCAEDHSDLVFLSTQGERAMRVFGFKRNVALTVNAEPRTRLRSSPNNTEQTITTSKSRPSVSRAEPSDVNSKVSRSPHQQASKRSADIRGVLRVGSEYQDGVWLLHIERETKGRRPSVITGDLRRLLRSRKPKVVLSVGELLVRDVEPALIAYLAGLYVHIQERRGRLVVCELSERATALLRKHRLLGKLNFYDTENAAVLALQEPPMGSNRGIGMTGG